MTTPLDRLRVYLGARYSADTIRAATTQARLFLNYAGVKDTYTQADIVSYCDQLVRSGHRTRSIRTILSHLKRLFEAIDQPWPVASVHGIHLPAQAYHPGPVLHRDEVAALIRGVRDERTPTSAIVALSTIYGLRPTELVQVLGAGLSGGFLRVTTAKGGHLRGHRIPEPVKAVLTFAPYQINRNQLHALFERLMALYVRGPLPGEGWHSIRRSLITGLSHNGIPDATVERFIGWQSRRTLMQYYQPFSEDLDAAIFAKHPFLIMWEECDV